MGYPRQTWTQAILPLLLETALVSMWNQMQCKFAPGSARLLKDGGRRGIHTWVFLVIAQGKNERAGKESSHRKSCLPRENVGISIKTNNPQKHHFTFFWLPKSWGTSSFLTLRTGAEQGYFWAKVFSFILTAERMRGKARQNLGKTDSQTWGWTVQTVHR